jgi:hypothetical protein
MKLISPYLNEAKHRRAREVPEIVEERLYKFGLCYISFEGGQNGKLNRKISVWKGNGEKLKK